ncbi:hypothetical protein T4D_9143 [Trichinella pseudospiralis]|uniref:Uncharacterized protein n=1 Tax=Trichinella pseudospiralis TaxID=6337 RepID=A0A0V1FK92_TRIPS|nr:hypothetical protein T4D_9143 [Trichinella pseudospiralis]
MLLIFKRSVIGTCQLVDKAFNVRQKKTGDANCPIDSAPIKADGELKKHVWEQAIDLAPAAFACSIHRYNLTAANCSCHEAGRHQIHPSSGHQVTAVQMEKVDKQEQAGQHKRNCRCTRASSSKAENSKQQDQKRTTSRYPPCCYYPKIKIDANRTNGIGQTRWFNISRVPDVRHAEN